MEAKAPRPEGSSALDTIIAQAKTDRKRLDSSAFGPVSLTALGIGSVVGAGIFVSVGTGAAEYAGPGVAISFLIAGIAAGVTALCFAELASMIPAAGSTYSYAYAAFGVFVAWFIGWDLLLEYLFAGATVAVGWSGYAVDMLESVGINVPSDLTNPPISDDGSPTGIINLPAVAVVALITGLLAFGMRQSARANNSIVFMKVAILVLFVIVGAFAVTADNWSPFVPSNEGGFGDYGASGVIRAAGLVFFAYVGFDAVSTAAAEARDPQRTIPIGLIATVIISTSLYVAIGLVMTGMAPYADLNTADPISSAIRIGNAGEWLEVAVDVAAVVGLLSTVLVTFYGQTRIFMRMSSDGMMPPAIGKVSKSRKTPIVATAICGVVGAAVAGFFPISILTNLVSIGTLSAFLIVCSGVLYLRRTRPDLERPFRVPVAPLTAGFGIVASLGLMITLPIDTFIRLLVWLCIGLVIFFFYARRHTRERFAAIQRGDYVPPEDV
jgi:APA family basic amino acid/polyamine antiporter